LWGLRCPEGTRPSARSAESLPLSLRGSSRSTGKDADFGRPEVCATRSLWGARKTATVNFDFVGRADKHTTSEAVSLYYTLFSPRLSSTGGAVRLGGEIVSAG